MGREKQQNNKGKQNKGNKSKNNKSKKNGGNKGKEQKSRSHLLPQKKSTVAKHDHRGLPISVYTKGGVVTASRPVPSNTEKAIASTVKPGDLRVADKLLPVSNTIVDTGVNSSLPVTVQLSTGALIALASSIVSHALVKGWLETLTDQSYVLGAIGYLANVFLSAALGTTPGLSTVPHWMNVYCQLLSPTEKSRNGIKFNYAWDSNANVNSITPVWQFSYGPGTSASNINFGKIDYQSGPTINDTYFSVVATDYNAEIGAAAVSLMYQFLNENADETMKAMHAFEPFGTPNRFTHDSTAFAQFVANLGGGAANSGGYSVRIGSETAIQTPLLCHFTSAVEGFSTTNRAPVCSEFTAGDAFTMGGAVSIWDDNMLRKIRQPHFKFYDFLDFAHTIALFVTKAIQKHIDDPENKLTELVDDQYWMSTAPTICPNMTLQDFSLLVRNELMRQFADTQYFAQTLYPKTIVNGPGGLTGLACGVGTAPASGVQKMLLPVYISEAIKNAVGRYLKDPIRSQDGKQFNNVLAAIPVLSMLYGATLNDADYQVTVNVNRQPQQFPVFTPVTTGTRKVPVKAVNSPSVVPHKPEKPVTYCTAIPQAEINLIDGAIANGWAYISDPGPLNKLVSSWNACMTALSTYIQCLTTMDKELGVSAMESLTTTIYLTVNTNEDKPKQTLPPRIGRPSVVSEGYGKRQSVLMRSCAHAPLSAVTQFPTFHPKNFVADALGGKSLTAYNIASFQGECYITNVTTNDDPVPLSNTLNAIADVCVNARDAGNNACTKKLLGEMAQGNGGILDDVVNVFSGVAQIGGQFVGGAVKGFL